MEILAIDDEYIALEGLMRSIKKASPEAQVYGFQSAEEAIPWLAEHRPDVVFTDVRMVGMDGLDFAKMVKSRFGQVDLIFTTGYDSYMKEAFDLYASGYLLKPITADKVREALENLRFYHVEKKPKLILRCFGDFEVFYNGAPVRFQLRRTKELLAYLVDRKGALCTLQQVGGILFEDDNHDAYMYKLRGDLIKTLDGLGCGEVLTRQYGHLGILPDAVFCDYYQWLEHPEKGGFAGEYMSQYSWAEYTLAGLQ